MKTLDFFREYLDLHPPKALVFCSDNQDNYAQGIITRLQLSFHDVTIGNNPNVIHMSCKDGSMTLYNVKGVELDEKQSHMGTILRVVCGSLDSDYSYTIIMQ